jgi:AAA domain, putative AbiEii toxin, Type IV TA system
MLTRLRLENFRAFSDLKVEKLARVNLFVGKNNAGKTALLEGAEILIRGGNPLSLWAPGKRRGELVTPRGEAENGDGRRVDARYMFHGRSPSRGQRFEVSGDDSGKPRLVSCAIIETPSESEIARILPLEWLAEHGIGPYALALIDDRHPTPVITLLAPDFGFYLSPRASSYARDELATCTFAAPGNPDRSWLGSLWSTAVLTPEEPHIVDALRIIETNVERVAFVPGSAGGFFVQIAGAAGRVPLGNMGDGMTRMLSLSLHLARSSRGYLLVDEIDAGLHHSVMEAMWRMVIETARRLDVQVLATTHSLDCVHALGLASAEAEDVLLHRIDRERPTTTTFTADEIVTAAEHQMEIR